MWYVAHVIKIFVEQVVQATESVSYMLPVESLSLHIKYCLCGRVASKLPYFCVIDDDHV